ncbi:3451_t:CDS:2, partial [Funneliformis caledonium]
MTHTALKNAIFKSFDNCIKDCKNWELEHTLQYLEESHIKFDEKDYLSNKKKLQSSSKISMKAIEIFRRQKNKAEENRFYYCIDKNVRKMETTISLVHVREVKRHTEISNQAKRVMINDASSPNVSPEIDNNYSDNVENTSDNENDENKSNDVLLQLESEVSNGGVDNRQFQDFQKNYLAMCNDMKWKLPSGSYVEDIIFNYTKDLSYECFILDIENETIMKLFDKKDQEYIKTYNIMDDPELEDRLMEYLVTFNETDISKMWDKINARIDITLYDPKNHFDYQYVYQVFANLYELRSGDFTRAHLEGKCDGILRELASIKEYAISKEGKLFTGKSRTKYLSNGRLKMPKVMKDMIKQKVDKLGMDFVKSQHLEIVRFLHSAQYLQQVIIDLPA